MNLFAGFAGVFMPQSWHRQHGSAMLTEPIKIDDLCAQPFNAHPISRRTA
jgi:hypothetical protein